jgi:protein-tyrosine-phosphatase
MTTPTADPIRVLFLCTGNSARSQIAEALLQRKAKERFRAGSAGTHPANEVHPGAVSALRQIGIEWSDRRPKTVESVQNHPWDLIITVCDKAKETCPLFPGRPTFAHWGMPDPAAVEDAGQRERAFANTVGLLSWRLDLMLAIRPEEMLSLVSELRLREIGLSTPTPSAVES